MNAAQLPLAPHNGTETSRIAASMVNVSAQEAWLLEAMAVGSDGWTQDELSEYCGLLRSAVAGRMNRLERYGLVKKDGTRVGRYGRPLAVYVLGASHIAQAAGARNSPAAT